MASDKSENIGQIRRHRTNPKTSDRSDKKSKHRKKGGAKPPFFSLIGAKSKNPLARAAKAVATRRRRLVLLSGLPARKAHF
jgi:hypothetical protein